MPQSIVHSSVGVTRLSAAACCLALFTAPAAFAAKNVLYKCVTAAGVTSIQSSSCPTGSTEAWHRETTPEPALTAEQAAQAEAKILRDQQRVRELSAVVEKKLQEKPGTVSEPTPAPAPTAEEASEQAAIDACQSAQTFAADVRTKPWLALTEGQLTRLFTWVAEQCKTPPKAD